MSKAPASGMTEVDAATEGRVPFSDFDSRGYRTVNVQTGYREWVATYEQTVADAMDIALLETLSAVPWTMTQRAADLGCGTGRTGAWLRGKGVTSIETYIHLLSEHVTAGLQAGWALVEMKEQVIDDTWLALKPKWERFRHHPISVAFACRKPSGQDSG